MMLPLDAQRGTEHWPGTISLADASGRSFPGAVAWMHATAPSTHRHWTEDARGLSIRAVEPADDIARANLAAGEGPYLLVQLPNDGHGALRLDKQTLNPRWVDLPADPVPPLPPDPEIVPGSQLPALDDVMVMRPDWPDPRSPLEYWRWAVRAQSMHVSPPLPAGDAVQVMTALHYAQLWALGLQRLHELDPVVADDVRELLIHTCSDRQQRFAAWLSDPQRIGNLLERLLADRQPPSNLADDVRNWLAARSPLIIWPVSEFGNQIRLSAFTMVDEPISATLRWEGASEGSAVSRFEPGVLTHVQVERLSQAQGTEPPRQVLIIETGRHVQRLEFGARQVVARPPGVFLTNFAPPLTLAEVQARVIRTAPASHATRTELRRLSGRWEVFVDCRRMAFASSDPLQSPESNQSPDALREDNSSINAENLRGREAITIALGDSRSPDGQPSIWLTVPENGWHTVSGGANDGTLQVHRRSLDDRWYCRVVLPDTWIPTPDRHPMLLALIRSHGDSDQLETFPGLSLPWRVSTAPIAIDLTHWDDLPFE